ncbi:MAG: N-formylglutamate amidohydrolase [Myxococcota bacterium]
MSGGQPALGRAQPRPAVVLTCEHASPEAPPGSGLDALVCRSHVGWDAGALGIAQDLAESLGTDVLAGTWTRLWVDLNRSADAPGVIPERTFGVDVPANTGLSDAARAARLAADWAPFRAEARRRLDAGISAVGRAVHLSVHTFSPDLDPASRTYEVGVLFDPARPAEAALAGRICERLRSAGLDARANEPYLGVDDGHTTALRGSLDDSVYAGLELELNQRFLDTPAWSGIVRALSNALVASLG